MVAKRKPKKRTTIKKRTTKKRTTKKKSSKKAAFGGYKINFKGHEESLEKVFGCRPIAPSQMTKKLWAYVKKNKLSNN